MGALQSRQRVRGWAANYCNLLQNPPLPSITVPLLLPGLPCGHSFPRLAAHGRASAGPALGAFAAAAGRAGPAGSSFRAMPTVGKIWPTMMIPLRAVPFPVNESEGERGWEIVDKCGVH